MKLDSTAPPLAMSAPSTEVGPAAAPDADKTLDEAQERRRKAGSELLLRIAEHVDFPSIQASIRQVRQTARADHAHLTALSDLILSDVGLTGKLLRIVNAAFYSTAGAGTITSMHRAVALVGVDSLELLAATLMVFDRVPKGRDGEAVREACGVALLSGWLAQQLCQSPRHIELVYLSALFMNLGEMLVAMHAPAQARRIQKKTQELVRKWVNTHVSDEPMAVATGPSQEQMHDLKQRAARHVIDMTFDDLGCEVARQWGWPDALVHQLRSSYPSGASATPDVGSPEYIRVLCTATSDLATSLRALPPDDGNGTQAAARDACMQRFQQAVGQSLKLDSPSLLSVGELAMEQRDSISAFLSMDAGVAGGPGARVTTGFKPKLPPLWSGPDRIVRGLDHALHGLQNAEHWAQSLDEVVEQLMVDLMEAMRLQRVVVCLRHPAAGDLCGVSGLGLRAAGVVAAFQVPVSGGRDLFSVLCRNGKAALVSDAADPVVWRSLPTWYTQKVGARTFALLPMVHQGVVQGLLYADKQMAGSLLLDEVEFKLLETVRDQLLATIIISRSEAVRG